MKTILGALIWIFVGIGAISAVTAYFVPTTLEAELFKSSTEPNTPGKTGPNGHLVLSSPAGPDVPGDGAAAPKWPAGTELTGDVLAAMSETQPNGEPLVKRVHVPEFTFARWSHKWWFAGSIVLLTLCGLGQRALGGKGEVKKGQAHPNESIAAAIAELHALRNSVAAMLSDEDRLDAIIDRVGDLQQGHLANFAEGRDVIIAKHGLGHYAQVMDAFAGAERKINRAWSAAADRVLGESFASLEEGIPLLEEAQRRLHG